MPECIRPYKLWDAGMCTNGYMEDTPTPTSPKAFVSRVKWISVEMDQVTAPNLWQIYAYLWHLQHPITSNNIPMDTKKISRMTPPDGPTVSRLPLEDLEDLGLPLKAPVIHSWLHSVGKPMITPWFKFIYYLLFMHVFIFVTATRSCVLVWCEYDSITKEWAFKWLPKL